MRDLCAVIRTMAEKGRTLSGMTFAPKVFRASAEQSAKPSHRMPHRAPHPTDRKPCLLGLASRSRHPSNPRPDRSGLPRNGPEQLVSSVVSSVVMVSRIQVTTRARDVPAPEHRGASFRWGRLKFI